MKNEKEFKKLIKKAHSTRGMGLGEEYDEYNELEVKALSLVKNRIKGNRKGLTNEPNYKHSIRVFKAVRKLHHWDDPDLELFLAALLHDIVEDGNTSFEELVEMGFSRRTLELIYLATHDNEIENHTERWMLMIGKLIEARDEEAWFIKLADLADNLKQSEYLLEKDRKFMVEVKAPLILRLTEWLFAHAYRYHSHLKNVLREIDESRQ